MARTTDKLKNFESNYEKLEQLVRDLEAPDLTLKQSLDLYDCPRTAKTPWIMPARKQRPWSIKATKRLMWQKECWTYDV